MPYISNRWNLCDTIMCVIAPFIGAWLCFTAEPNYSVTPAQFAFWGYFLIGLGFVLLTTAIAITAYKQSQKGQVKFTPVRKIPSSQPSARPKDAEFDVIRKYITRISNKQEYLEKTMEEIAESEPVRKMLGIESNLASHLGFGIGRQIDGISQWPTIKEMRFKEFLTHSRFSITMFLYKRMKGRICPACGGLSDDVSSEFCAYCGKKL